jgi:hypothetical protein
MRRYMSSYLDGIPQAVAAIVTAVPHRFGTPPQSDADVARYQKSALDYADQLTRMFVKALIEAQVKAGKP